MSGIARRIQTSDGRRFGYLDLVTASNPVLEGILRAGVMPDARALYGWEFRGTNTNDLTVLLGFRTFKKGFTAADAPTQARDRLQGYDVDVVQNGLRGPWSPKRRKDGSIVTRGYFDVSAVDPGEKDNLYPNAVLLNHACGRNPALDPSRLLRDYLVQVRPENPDLYLGKAMIAVGPGRRFVSFFVLERHNRCEWAGR
jgi:hypothetical protein